MASQTTENYLKAIFHLALKHDNEINTTDIANALSVKMSSVNNMVKKMAEQGLLNYEKYKPLRITEKGKKEAALIIRKHRLTEMYLVEKMGIGWEEVHEIAEQIEHIKSPLFFERIDTILGHPETDPHGSPIPDREGNIKLANHILLSECNVGDKVKIKALKDSSEEFLKFLNSKELSLETVLFIKEKEPFDNSIVVSYDNNKQEVFSNIICSKLLVKKYK
jgi:DtxR family Mn-dependent transcriptional regulator